MERPVAQTALEFFHSLFLARTSRNPSYSLRAFARDVGLSPSLVSSLFKSKRVISAELASDIALKLKLSPTDTALFMMLAQREKDARNKEKTTRKEKVSQMTELNHDQIELLVNWWHHAILTLFESEGFKSDPSWIAHKLKIDESIVVDSLQKLLRVGLIERQGKNLRLVLNQTTTSVDIPSWAIRQSHKDRIALGAKIIEDVPVPLRDFSSVSICVDRAKIADAKKEIEKFRRKFMLKFDNKAGRDVFFLNVQLFPVTQE